MSTDLSIYPEDIESIPFAHPGKILDIASGWPSMGTTAGGQTIPFRHFPSERGKHSVLLVGGVHGNETEGIIFLHDFIRKYLTGRDTSPFSFHLWVIPVLNVDGLLAFTRQNANRVDLNRNMNTKDWTSEVAKEKYYPGPHSGSEPETMAMETFLAENKMDYIISLHSWKPMINLNGPAMDFAQKMHEYLDFPIVEDIGYPTPGSLGTYAGWERNIPTITLEFQRGLEHETIFPLAEKGILHSFTVLDQ